MRVHSTPISGGEVLAQHSDVVVLELERVVLAIRLHRVEKLRHIRRIRYLHGRLTADETHEN
jgi:hypothetical protein